jgi:hypothetical protein
LYIFHLVRWLSTSFLKRWYKKSFLCRNLVTMYIGTHLAKPLPKLLFYWVHDTYVRVALSNEIALKSDEPLSTKYFPQACFCNRLEIVQSLVHILGLELIDINAKDNQVKFRRGSMLRFWKYFCRKRSTLNN